MGIHRDATENSFDDELEIANLDCFNHVENRSHNSFPDIKRSPLKYVDVVAFDIWITKHQRKMSGNI